MKKRKLLSSLFLVLASALLFSFFNQDREQAPAAPTASVAPSLPKPDQTLMIPMRDGKELATDIYLPAGNAKNLPCILVRSPLGRSAVYLAEEVLALVPHGYMVAFQETRNWSEEGILPYMHDGWAYLQDGYDTVEWLAKNELTNGNIGTWGKSAMGITQMMLAPTAPPSLKCQYIKLASPSLYHSIFADGTFKKEQVEGWLSNAKVSEEAMPIILSQKDYNPFWENLNALEMFHEVKTPTLYYGGWYDIFSEGTLSAFENHLQKAQADAMLVMGPWTHFPENENYGNFKLKSHAKNPPVDTSLKRWFDHYLKNEENGIGHEARIHYYVMGPLNDQESKGNVWKTANSWPVPHKIKDIHLQANQELSFSPAQQDKVLSFEHDHEAPVPTVGGRNLYIDSGPMDQSQLVNRTDVLSFSSPAFDEDMEVTGVIRAELTLSNNSDEDTTLFVRLCDIHPDGSWIQVTEGSKLYPSEPGKAATIELNLAPTSLVFAKGHKLGIILSNSNFPAYQHVEKPHTHNLHIGPGLTARLELPVVDDTL